MNAYDMLVLARAKIANPSNWTQEDYAKDIAGNSCSANDPEAVAWCAFGACDVVQGEDFNWENDKYLNAALQNIGYSYGPATYNDTHTHAEVLAMFDKAIELAAKEAS